MLEFFVVLFCFCCSLFSFAFFSPAVACWLVVVFVVVVFVILTVDSLLPSSKHCVTYVVEQA